MLVILAGLAAAGEPAPSRPARGGDPASAIGPLGHLPSAPAGHIEKIKGLADNTWLQLDTPAPDPKYGRAFGRSWSGKAMVLANDLRGALYTGEGPHCYVKPDGFGMDDYWFYDLNSNAWICLFPGTDVKNFTAKVRNRELVVNDQGFVVDQQGRLVPGHLMIHAWGFLTYNPDGRKFAFLPYSKTGYKRYFMPGLNKKEEGFRMEEGFKEIELQIRAKKPAPVSPWFYDVKTGTFELYVIKDGAKMDFSSGFPQFFYIPSKKAYFSGSSVGVGFFDPVTLSWRKVEKPGILPKGFDFGGCHDTKRDRIYLGGETSADTNRAGPFYVFDLKTETMTNPRTTGGAFPERFGANFAVVNYDSANDRILIISSEDKKVYALNPETNEWLPPLPVPGQVIDRRTPFWSGFYDPLLNACFVYMGADGADNGQMWVYRYKNNTRASGVEK